MSKEGSSLEGRELAIKQKLKQELQARFPEYSALFTEEIIEEVFQQGRQELFQDVRVGRDLIINGDIIQEIKQIIELPTPPVPSNIKHNLPYSGVVKFIGRINQLEKLHEKLQQGKKVAITAIAGMGGVGKTELALQYALQYQENYPGSISWFKGREEDLSSQILEFAGTYLNVYPTEQQKTDVAKVEYCWARWGKEKSLIVIDDVLDYGKTYQEKIKPYLPPSDSRFKVLMTSRQQPGRGVEKIDLNVLLPEAAVRLMEALIGKDRIEAEREKAEALCKWLGCLPLGLELVGRYLYRHKTLSLETMLQRLEKQKLAAKALLEPKTKEMTAQLGVAAAFELSWSELNPEAQELGSYLSLFGSEPFKWSWVEEAWGESTDEDELEEEKEELEELRDEELVDRNLLKVTIDRDSQSLTEPQYQLHALISEYFRAKLEESEGVEGMKQNFCRQMMEIARSIPETPTQEDIRRVAIAIPHLSMVAKQLTEYVDDENLIWSFVGLGFFYQGQGAYDLAEEWYERSVKICRSRLGQEHPDVAASKDNLALLYKTQGRYEEAEPLYVSALEMYSKILGEEHPCVAKSKNNLAELYKAQGRYEKAEPLLLKALEMNKRILGEEHPDVATSKNNLAELYLSQGRYEKAEPLLVEALEMRKNILGQEHPNVATSNNNLAGLYLSQGRYEKAEPLLLETLEMNKRILGQEHPNVAQSLNSLAELYRVQGRYKKAEPLLLEALEMNKRILGEEHPDVATSKNNLAGLYLSQGRYEEAEPLYVEALEMTRRVLGEEHPDVAQSMNNLAECYGEQGRYKEAESLLLEALKKRKRILGEEHPYVANSKNNLAELYKAQGRYEEAETLYQQALAIAERVLGAEHPMTKIYRENYHELQEERWYLEAAAGWEGDEKIEGENMNPDDELGIDELLEKLERAIDEPDLFS